MREITHISLPEGAEYIINTLQRHGHSAYIVGGCVRDSLLGVKPKDWDICTSAELNDVRMCFYGYDCILTGEKYGTVTVVMDDATYEVTTFRKDGKYSDNRHPDAVVFTLDVCEDLSRRDFTINAMAYNHKVGVLDLFHGIDDLNDRIIRCVGDPDKRFNEDALRILRAIRFATRYGYRIDEGTSEAMRKYKTLLKRVAQERLRKELEGILSGESCTELLLKYSDIICTVIPELKRCVGFEQNNKYHQYTVYEHMLRAVDNYQGTDMIIKLALFLHDIGKPLCYSEDENGGHFYGHAEPSAEISEKILKRLRYDKKTIENVTTLIRYHDAQLIPSKKSIHRWLARLGEENFKRLLCIRNADILAHRDGTQDERLQQLDAIWDTAFVVLDEENCFSVRDLEINGNDVMNLGIKQGKAVGNLLNAAFDAVLSGEVQNDRAALIAFVEIKIRDAANKEYS